MYLEMLSHSSHGGSKINIGGAVYLHRRYCRSFRLAFLDSENDDFMHRVCGGCIKHPGVNM
jgi:hypothetical protein